MRLGFAGFIRVRFCLLGSRRVHSGLLGFTRACNSGRRVHSGSRGFTRARDRPFVGAFMWEAYGVFARLRLKLSQPQVYVRRLLSYLFFVVLCACLSGCAPVCAPGPRMDVFNRACVDLELPRELLSSFLQRAYSEVQLADIRLCLFGDATFAGLVNSKDVLARRLKRALGPPLSKKYADDVADIVYCIKNCHNLLRVLLKNGKRSAAVYNSARERRPFVSATPPSPPVLSSAAAEQAAGTQLRDQYGCNDDCALLQSDTTHLKNEVADIQRELLSLKCCLPPLIHASCL